MTKLTLSNEKINSHGGLGLAGKLIAKFCRFGEFFKVPAGNRSDRIADTDILTAQIGLLVQGRTHYDDIELFRQDQGSGFVDALGLKKVPAESTLRPRLKALATVATMKKLEGSNLALLKAHVPTALEINGRKYIPNGSVWKTTLFFLPRLVVVWRWNRPRELACKSRRAPTG